MHGSNHREALARSGHCGGVYFGRCAAMTVLQRIPLPGCRHDVLGHALKAIGVLRALAECAAPEDRDPSAEGWWDTNTATFTVRSDHYPDPDSLAKFFAEKYRPTPMIAAWNKSGGVTGKV